MEVHRLGIKFFAVGPASIQLADFIPVFHGWIQKQNIAGHLLIDVHDYSHMHEGPGILLVAHEGNFSIDSSNGRPGLFYYRKAPSNLSPVEHLTSIFKTAVQACRLLEQDARIRFDLNEGLVLANDRLNAPNNEVTFSQLKPLLAAALQQTLNGPEFQMKRVSSDPMQRLAVACTRSKSPD